MDKAATAQAQLQQMLNTLDDKAKNTTTRLLDRFAPQLPIWADYSKTLHIMLVMALCEGNAPDAVSTGAQNMAVDQILRQFPSSVSLQDAVRGWAQNSRQDRTGHDMVDLVLKNWPRDQLLPDFLCAWLHENYRSSLSPTGRCRSISKNQSRDTLISGLVICLREECGIPFETDNRRSCAPVTACHIVAAWLTSQGHGMGYENVRRIWKAWKECYELLGHQEVSRPKFRRPLPES